MAENHLAHHHASFPAFDKETGKLHNYGQLIRHPLHANTWNRSYANKMGRLCQVFGTVNGGVRKRIEGTDTFHVVRFENIPKKCLKEVCYTSVVCDVRTGKKTQIAPA